MIKIKRALLSVSDKKGIVRFARGLSAKGVEIISTGGTAKQLSAAGIAVIDVSTFTGFPEMLDGRVKTLHPKIHGGILALRNKPEHLKALEEHNIGLIDMVVVNLYPFETVIKKNNVSLDEAIENIDIGGPAMLRSAAKNYKSVAVVCNPDRYNDILKELDTNSGILSDSFLYNLAVEAFSHTARYDSIINNYLAKRVSAESFNKFPKEINFKYSKLQDLRYGENPHQAAAFYKQYDETSGFAALKQLHGKELSFNNFLDLNFAIDFVKDFDKPVAAIIKHNNPAGVAQAETLETAFKEALKCDSVSAFGGIIALNKSVDGKTAKAIEKSGFMECVIAPKFTKEALEVLTKKKNLRLLEIDFAQLKKSVYDFKLIYGGILLQEKDNYDVVKNDLKFVSKRKPTAKELESLLFAWKIVKNIKSNAIVLVKGTKTVGVGCGQTSRVESIKIAIQKAGNNSKNSVLASDGFLPKTDNIDFARKAKVKAIIHPGGSIADEEVVAAANKAGIAIVTTGIRHFKH